MLPHDAKKNMLPHDDNKIKGKYKQENMFDNTIICVKWSKTNPILF